MEVSIGSRIKHAWNAFLNRNPTGFYRDIGVGYSYRPDRPRLTRGNERSIVTSVYNRIALDCASISIQHVRLDDSERFLEKIPSGLNDCLNLSANIDQTGRAFLQDVVLSMLDEGCVAIIPVDTDDEPSNEGSDVESGESDSGADYDSIVNELLDGLEKEIDEIIGNYVSDDEEET